MNDPRRQWDVKPHAAPELSIKKSMLSGASDSWWDRIRSRWRKPKPKPLDVPKPAAPVVFLRESLKCPGCAAFGDRPMQLWAETGWYEVSRCVAPQTVCPVVYFTVERAPEDASLGGGGA